MIIGVSSLAWEACDAKGYLVLADKIWLKFFAEVGFYLTVNDPEGSPKCWWSALCLTNEGSRGGICRLSLLNLPVIAREEWVSEKLAAFSLFWLCETFENCCVLLRLFYGLFYRYGTTYTYCWRPKLWLIPWPCLSEDIYWCWCNFAFLARVLVRAGSGTFNEVLGFIIANEFWEAAYPLRPGGL